VLVISYIVYRYRIDNSLIGLRIFTIDSNPMVFEFQHTTL
jgi:hypothetical protein